MPDVSLAGRLARHAGGVRCGLGAECPVDASIGDAAHRTQPCVGILGSVIGVGAASGPIVGGLLLGSFGWKSIFIANMPAAAIALAVLVKVKIDAVVGEDPAVPAAGAARSVVMAAPAERSGLVRPSFLAAFATQAQANLGQYSLLLIAPIVLTIDNGAHARRASLFPP